MRFKKILLVYPRYPGSHYKGEKNSCPPIGLGIIAETLSMRGVLCDVVDLGLGYSEDYLLKRIADYKPDAIGISMMTFRYEYLYSVLNRIKKSFHNITIIAGGPHVTAWKAKVLHQCPSIDFGICGEGEFTVTELNSGIELGGIRGLIYRENGEIHVTPDREPNDNLDIIPFPKYGKFELDKYAKVIQINSSRGCPYSCIFCQSCSMLGKKWRSRSAESITDEISFWHTRGYKNFTFVDDNFTMDKKLIHRLCDKIEAIGLENASFSAPGVRVDLVDGELLKRMRQIGFERIAFGIEAGNNNILSALKKGFTIERAEESVNTAVKLGYAVKLYFLVGSPYETLEDIKDSVSFALKYPVVDVNFGSLMPIPETELMDWVLREGKLLAPPEVYLNRYAEFERVPHFFGPGMSLAERKYALRFTERVRRKIQRNARERVFRKRLSRLGALSILGAKLLRFEATSNLFDSRTFRPLKHILKKIYG